MAAPSAARSDPASGPVAASARRRAPDAATASEEPRGDPILPSGHVVTTGQDGDAPAPLFAPDGDGFVAAGLARGPWDELMMHGGAPSALLARAVQAVRPGAELVVTRLTVDFLSGVTLGRVDVGVTVVRPGRRFQVVDATLAAGGRHACLARAVRVRRADLPGAEAPGPADGAQLPPPERCERLDLLVERGHDRELFHPDAVEIRHVAGAPGSGAVAAWIRMRGQLVAGEAPTPLARVAAAADFANGLSWILPFESWLFVNTELTIHLRREPEGEWIGLDARTAISSAGYGLSTGTLHDVRGPVGVCAQSLFVEPR